MNKIPLEKANMSISGIEIRSNFCDLHHDIAQYVNYIQNKEVRRSARTNCLLKADVIKLSKLMSCSELIATSFNIDEPNYPAFIEQLAYDSGFVDFRVKGNNYRQHIHLPLREQEEKILATLNADTAGTKVNNEFVCRSPVGILDNFMSYYVGDVVKTIDFPKVRLFLLELLSNLEVNHWYDVKSLIAYLKFTHPYFLVPRQPEIIKVRLYGPKNLPENRYNGFYDMHERKMREVNSTDKDGFERVEGRYIERFLEFIPFLLRYVELAYKHDKPEGQGPSLGTLSAFMVTPRFFNLKNSTIQEAKVIVQPNFEVTVESDIYPAAIMLQLESIGRLLKKDVLSQFQLEKNKTVQKLASDPSFDPVKYLTLISSMPVPENVKTELKEWGACADAFILYEDFDLLESSFKFPNIEKFIAQKIDGNFNIITNAKGLINELECNQTVPLTKITHKDSKFSELGNEYKTILSKGKQVNKKASANLEKLKIGRMNLIKLLFADDKALVLLSNQLLEKACIINIIDEERAIIMDLKDEKILKQVLKDISDKYKPEFDLK